MQLRTINQEWKDWIRTNLDRGVAEDTLVDTLIQHNYAPEFVTPLVRQMARGGGSGGNVAVVERSPARDWVRKAEQHLQTFDYSTVGIRPQGNTITTSDREVHVLINMAMPRIVLLGNLLSHEECDELIRLSASKLKRSTTVDRVTGEAYIEKDRTSEGTYFHINENPFIARLDKRISEVMSWPVENGEGIQILHYNRGAEYKPHFDYFPPEEAGSGVHLAHGGQRVATLVMYLNDVDEGGETIFPDIGLNIAPRKGSAAYFAYCDQHNRVDPLTLHGGNPVIRGEKWIATKWMRQREYR